MKRALPLLAATAATLAQAHPGHHAPTVHAHDFTELLLYAGVVLAVALGIWGGRMIARRRQARRDR